MKYLLLTAFFAVTACKHEQEVKIPDPVLITEYDVSYCCQMTVLGHEGPKGQIHLKNQSTPLFFTQVRDVIAYLKAPERDAEILAVYVSDLAAAPSWADMGEGNWIDANTAYFVVGAEVRGGMGAPEIVPFSKADAAQKFTAQYGGMVMSLADIPKQAVLGEIDMDMKMEIPE
ncbi:MAG: nitrous oxide reductase accessory protein NosL [Amylibacter sp.]|nr:nitrous oxide reductase accessory protein NosL [Amylibacter sp.]